MEAIEPVELNIFLNSIILSYSVDPLTIEPCEFMRSILNLLTSIIGVSGVSEVIFTLRRLHIS